MGGNLTDKKEEISFIKLDELHTVKLVTKIKEVVVPEFVKKEVTQPVYKEVEYEKPVLKRKEYIIPRLKEEDLLDYLKEVLPPLLKEMVVDIVSDLNIELEGGARLNLKVK